MGRKKGKPKPTLTSPATDTKDTPIVIEDSPVKVPSSHPLPLKLEIEDFIHSLLRSIGPQYLPYATNFERNDLYTWTTLRHAQEKNLRKIGLPYGLIVAILGLNKEAQQNEASARVPMSVLDLTPKSKYLSDQINNLKNEFSKMKMTRSGGPQTFAHWWRDNQNYIDIDTRMLGEHEDFFFNKPEHLLPSGSSEAKTVQPKWDELCLLLQKKEMGLKNIPVSRFKTPSVGTRKPDTPIYIADKPRTEFYISSLIDLKGSMKGEEFAPEDKAHLVSFLFSLLEFSPRNFVIGILCDGNILQGFKVTPQQTSPNLIQMTPVYHLNGDGGRRLMWLFNASPEQLGMRVYNIKSAGKEVQITDFLGRGGHSIAYSALHKHQTVVVKVYPEREGYKDELLTLQRLSHIPYVPKFIAESDDKNAILLTPVATPFYDINVQHEKAIEIKSEHMGHLIDVLKEVHRTGIIHGDIKTANFFPHPQYPGKVLLNDWSSASEKGVSPPSPGTFLYAARAVLECCVRKERFKAAPQHDLESVVKCMYLATHPFMVAKINLQNPQEVLEMWGNKLDRGIWKKMMDCIGEKTCDYDKLKDLVLELQVL